MKWLYRITLIIAGCYFESAIRNVTEMVLYWTARPNVLQGFLPYVVPMLFGYAYALEVRDQWSGSRLKNDIMAYMGSTVLIGYPLFITISFWVAGAQVDPTTSTIRMIATAVLFVNLAIATMVWRKAVKDGWPFSLPWGTQVGVADEDWDEELDEDQDAGADVDAGAEADAGADVDANAATGSHGDEAHRVNADTEEDAEAQDTSEPAPASGDRRSSDKGDNVPKESAEKKPE